MDKRMMLKLNGGRTVSGILRGFDPFMNVVIDETVEDCRDGTKNTIGMVVRTFHTLDSPSAASRINPVSRPQVIRGNSIVLVEGLERV